MPPLTQGLTGDGEDEIYAHVLDPGLPEESERSCDLGWAVRYSQSGEILRVKGLRPQRNPRDSEIHVGGCSPPPESRRIRLQVDFRSWQNSENLPQTLQESSEEERGEHAGSAAAEVDRFEARDRQSGGPVPGLRQKGVNKASHVRVPRGVLVK